MRTLDRRRGRRPSVEADARLDEQVRDREQGGEAVMAAAGRFAGPDGSVSLPSTALCARGVEPA
ncbi:hypothetical protein [Nonomuraea jabiensis]|uniref:hypothetical protein n=1 Tax=Nonomuraea jabiensis TaxID=882448 RepID=UPI003674B882